MGGWQRLGIVVSVLWILCSPFYLLFASNQQALANMRDCLRVVEHLQSDDVAAIASQRCQETYWREGMPSDRFIETLLLQRGHQSLTVWAFILTPLALLWLVGSSIIGTARWIRRGFVGS
jgi:hypothetical protein